MKPTPNRRYYLHRRLKRFCYVDAHARMISITAHTLETLPVLYRKYLNELQTAGYSVQFAIPA